MKKFKITALVLAAVLLVHGLCGCTLITVIGERLVETIQKGDVLPDLSFLEGEASVIAFGKESVEEELSYMTPEDLKNYASPSLKYGSTVYFEALNDNERIVYNTVLYALDHSMQVLLIDDRLLGKNDRPFVEIYQMASLDSPLIPQNLYISSAYLTLNLPEGRVRATAYTVTAFSEKQASKRAQALQKAEEILQMGESKQPPKESATFFYHFLGTSVSYTTETGDDPCYLYDTLITGKTLCDGYANTFSLLCNMAGIPCFEKAYYTDDGEEGDAGHTWNCVYIDGGWHNVDATASKESENATPLLKCFGYGDELQEHTPNFAELLPQATPIKPYDLILADMSAEDVPALLEDAFEKNNKELLVLFEAFPPQDYEERLSLFAEKLLMVASDSISYYGYAMAGKYVCYFYEM